MPFEGLLNYEGADEEEYVRSLVKQIRTPVPRPKGRFGAAVNMVLEATGLFGGGTAGQIDRNADAQWALMRYVNNHEGVHRLDPAKREGILSIIRGEQNR